MKELKSFLTPPSSMIPLILCKRKERETINYIMDFVRGDGGGLKLRVIVVYLSTHMCIYVDG